MVVFMCHTGTFLPYLFFTLWVGIEALSAPLKCLFEMAISEFQPSKSNTITAQKHQGGQAGGRTDSLPGGGNPGAEAAG
eukprot:1158705-Pelagomonas_calceolata.AAC.16